MKLLKLTLAGTALKAGQTIYVNPTHIVEFRVMDNPKFTGTTISLLNEKVIDVIENRDWLAVTLLNV